MIIPKAVSGRPVTRRGVHLLPFGHHGGWVGNAKYWIDLLQSMHMSWCVLLSESDAAYKSGAAQALLDGGIIPIVRFACEVPNRFSEMAATEQLVNLYSRYNAPCIIQHWNEPFDDREAANKWPPKNNNEAWRVLADRWNEAANEIVKRGAIAGFPDGPTYDRNPFTELGDPSGFWESGQAVYLGHFYGKGRPLDYPSDDVSRNGTQLTMEEYRAALDDYADDPAWNEGAFALALLNQQRREWANSQALPLTDDTCWRGWEKVQWYARQAFGFDVQIAMTEGGWVPRDLAGTILVDIRWPMVTPRKVAELTLAMFEAESPLFAICPWLLADTDMGGSGWPFDAWHGWAYSERYGQQKPVIPMLQQNPPGQVVEPDPEPPPTPDPGPDLAARKRLLSSKLGEVVTLWRQVQEAIPSTLSS